MELKIIDKNFCIAFVITILFMITGCNGEIDNNKGLRVFFISSTNDGNFRYQCSQIKGSETIKITFIDKANKYNVGDTVWIDNVCKK